MPSFGARVKISPALVPKILETQEAFLVGSVGSVFELSTQQVPLWLEQSLLLESWAQSRQTPVAKLESPVSQYLPVVPEQLQAESEPLTLTDPSALSFLQPPQDPYVFVLLLKSLPQVPVQSKPAQQSWPANSAAFRQQQPQEASASFLHWPSLWQVEPDGQISPAAAQILLAPLLTQLRPPRQGTQDEPNC